MAVRIQHDDFDAGVESRALQNSSVGAVALFVGTVRGKDQHARDDTDDHTGTHDVTAMTLEHYPGMTEAEIERIEAAARDRWPLSGVTVIHRVGRLLPNDQIVLVAAAAAHRQDAFDAAQFIMDFLKTDAPFWKAEERNGKISWVDARDSDNRATQKWR